MKEVLQQIRKNRKFLELLSKQYPTVQSVCTEIINLRTILNLPKGTEHFLSDLHGEYEAFTHIINNCSGVIREKVDAIFGESLDYTQRSELCTLIYYPKRKLELVKKAEDNLDQWYESALLNLISLCRSIATKYTRSKVRKALPPDFSYIIDELLHTDSGSEWEKILESILAIDNADDFIVALATLIKRLAVDHLHIVGDIFDRGPRPDLIMDELMEHHSVDIQWGNHDVLWMGAAAGNDTCIAAVINNSIAYGNLQVLEQGYGINLRPLAMFAEETYADSPGFAPQESTPPAGAADVREAAMAGKIHKAVAVMLFKLEGQLYRRHPEYGMEDRILLDKVDLEAGTVLLHGRRYPMRDCDFPTVSAGDPLALSDREQHVLQELRHSFVNSKRLQKQIGFLYSHGSMYRIYNHNLLYHGCIPMEEDGSFSLVSLCGEAVKGRSLLDRADQVARTAYFGTGQARRQALDAMWYLWCGRGSPLFGRSCMTTFERLYLADKSTWTERKNPYYDRIQSADVCRGILEEFGLYEELSHIVNGHVPVRASEGESPVKGGGKLIVIDGGFCRAYHPRTGIAGYTLIYNSYGLRLAAHHPFGSAADVVGQNVDIHSTTQVFETLQQRILVADTDIGQHISEQIYDLSLLLTAYRSGRILADEAQVYGAQRWEGER